MQQVQALLKRKNLDLSLFEKKANIAMPNLQSDISEHVKWVFNNIYRVAYPGNLPEPKKLGIARYFHGIQHVSRVALYVQVLANLYRKHDDQDAKKLKDEDVKLLQIAGLFHDSAREDENVDRWDHESAIFLYYYLTRILEVDKTRSKLIAEDAANKDPRPKIGHFTIRLSRNCRETG
jgi:hypothetical protein